MSITEVSGTSSPSRNHHFDSHMWQVVNWRSRSLTLIGHVVDVHRLGAAYIAGVALGSDADAVALRDGRAEMLLPGGERETSPLEVAR